jgi:hypothetical protein
VKKPAPIRAGQKLKQVNAIIAKLDDGKNIHFLDIGEKFLQPDGSITKEIMPDFLHLSAAGYQIWADAISPKLAELMKYLQSREKRDWSGELMTLFEQTPGEVFELEAGGHDPADLLARHFHGGGHDGIQQDGDMRESLGEVVEHAVEPGGLGGIFGEGEGLRAIDESVRMSDDFPRGGDAVMDGPAVHAFEIGGQGIGDGLAESGVFGIVIVCRA